MPSGLVSGAGLSKDSVDYRQHEKCLTCMHFYPANSCEIVSGNISPEAVCNRWEIKKRDEGKDGHFYKEQLEKVGGEAHLAAIMKKGEA
jgi:hypothetical protein